MTDQYVIKPYIWEEYKMLRTNIKYASYDNEVKTILVTSTTPNEGKSSTVVNLALTMVQDDKKVLVIDCDLRKPTIHKKFGVSNIIGLSDFIAIDVNYDDLICVFNENLHIISAGSIPPNPSEMLAARKLEHLLNIMKNQYDIILIDSPPILPVTDAQILANIVDGTILVVASGNTKKDDFISAYELIKRVNGNIIGIVMNKLPISKNKYANESYYYKPQNNKIENKKTKNNKHIKKRVRSKKKIS